MQRAFTSFLDRLQARRPRRIPLAQAFTAQGVTLRDAASWSGIRDDDGGVVIAIHRADIRAIGEGFSCLLWAPPAGRRDEATGEPRMEDRLAHCRVASWAGTADGLIVGVDADVQAGSIVTMHVEKRQHRYWATWGFVARLGGQPAAAGWASERMPALAAA